MRGWYTLKMAVDGDFLRVGVEKAGVVVKLVARKTVKVDNYDTILEFMVVPNTTPQNLLVRDNCPDL